MPSGEFLSHFTCYDVRVTSGTARFQPRTVSVETDFENVDVLVRRPSQLCVPANKNGARRVRRASRRACDYVIADDGVEVAVYVVARRYD